MSRPCVQVDIEAQVWEATRHDLQCISEDEQQMVALVENRSVVFESDEFSRNMARELPPRIGLGNATVSGEVVTEAHQMHG